MRIRITYLFSDAYRQEFPSEELATEISISGWNELPRILSDIESDGQSSILKIEVL